jgi:hypothetical protein
VIALPLLLAGLASQQGPTPAPFVAADALLRTVPETVEEHWSSGGVRVRYEIDDRGRRHGACLEYAEDGTLLLRAQYRAGALDGTWSSFHPGGEHHVTAKYRAGKLQGDYVERTPAGERAVKATYKDGVLDGERTFYAAGRVDGVQRWKQGALVELDGFVPFPRPLPEIAAEQLALRAATPARVELTPDNEAAFLAAERARGLARLKEYRALIGLRFDDLELDPDFDLHAQWGARLCAAIGRLDHRPANPGWPDAEYLRGYRGTRYSNLASVDDAARSVDMYMDDSDDSNIARIGHRMHCIAGELRRTGFGCFQGYSAMWSMDRSGKPRKLDVAAYPPAGYVPVDRFAPRIAWSLTFYPGFRRVPGVAELRIEVVPLDADYRPAGEPLALDHVARLGTDTLVFRPAGLQVGPGLSYRLSIEGLDGGKRGEPYRALIEFVSL